MTELRKIMHVEDDPDIQEIAAIALEMIGGLEIVQFSSGAVAIERAAAEAPDLLLLDVMMPGLSGEQTLLGLRALPGFATVPAIFMTAKAQETDVESLIALGALGVITKPFDPMTLADEVRALWAAR
ncbi:response regulator [Frigidibacter sp. MR17.24]|uniref:response regulator n=1 Tax=Frigidibacter sp. MR17.24 TaxID=3127345 RepID=UPI003012B8AC